KTQKKSADLVSNKLRIGVFQRYQMKCKSVSKKSPRYKSLVGATVVRRRVYARFLDAVNFVAGNPEADPEQELTDRWVVEQMSALTAMTASFVLATPTETDGALFPGRIMLANTCMWTYRSDECGYTGGAVADEFDKPTTDIRKDRCSKCMRGCELRRNVGNFGGFLSINKLSQ
ncbi:phage minor tail protein L, partial [Escherichia coli]|uniref:phage minor tail protein L n=1 Tax=Escherichia coli TaxID=562 RepID=UPI0022650AF5